jgi:hypothetical protein
MGSLANMGSQIRSTSSTSSLESERVFDMPSCQSEVTQPTVYSFRTFQKPPHDDTYEIEYAYTDSDESRQSHHTFESTSVSDDDDEASDFESSELNRPEESQIYIQSQVALPSNPRNFNQYFPSRDRLLIRHDDATLDGNMNLRIDSHYALPSGRTMPLTLFHMRMHDLKSRDFSLRRYCRESGREVCHSSRQFYRGFSCLKPGLQQRVVGVFNKLARRKSIPSSSSLNEVESEQRDSWMIKAIKLFGYSVLEVNFLAPTSFKMF